MGKFRIKSKGAVTICIVAIILIIVLLVRQEQRRNLISELNNQNNQIQNAVIDEFVTKQADGTRVNNSEQLKTTKTIDGLEIKSVRLEEKNGSSQLVAEAKNTTNSIIEEYQIIITAVDKNGKALKEFTAKVYGVAPGGTAIFQAFVTSDIANAYDFTVRKK